MSILSDSEIAARCRIPPNATYFDETLYNAKIAAQDRIGWPLTNYAVNELRSSIRAECTRMYTDDQYSTFRPMISPFHEGQVREIISSITKPISGVDDVSHMTTIPSGTSRKMLSYGLSSYGYDVRLSGEIKLFSNINSTIVDPKRFDQACLIDATPRYDDDGSSYVILPPNSYMLGRTVETFFIPRDVMVICLGKSTYARCGVIINVTPIEPEFDSTIVLEASNSTGLPVKIYLNEGFAQFLFFQGDQPCAVSYADRHGKYQGQEGIQLAKV